MQKPYLSTMICKIVRTGHVHPEMLEGGKNTAQF